jgi:hypothetical protein
MPRVGFEPTTPVFELAKTVNAIDRVASVIGRVLLLVTYEYNHALDYCGEYKHLIPLDWQQPQGAACLEDISLRTLDISVGVRPLEHWGRGSESYSRHGCLCAFILCLCCFVCR